MSRRYLRIVLVTAVSTILVLTLLGKFSGQSFGLGWHHGPSEEEIKSGKNILPDLRVGKPDKIDPNWWRAGDGTHFREPKIDAKSPYPVGKTKPAGSNYTRCLVMPKMAGEDTRWIQQELGDMLDSGLLTTAVYAMDNPTAALHPVENKGNEVMAYLSYIIDFYDNMPDVAIFMHSHRFAWHNNFIFDEDAALMVRHPSPERVTREGYMNLRCHWDPGCPAWLHPRTREKNKEKEEQMILADSWTELFPGEEIPMVLAQACCAQFAVSRERIMATPKERFLQLRDWVLKTALPDDLAGRVFEYTWQYIFTSSPFHCPSMSACYCDGYGLCFGDPEKFDYYFELNFNKNEYKEELRQWNLKAEKVALAREKAKAGDTKAEESLEIPEASRDVWLEADIRKIEEEMRKRKEAAVELGKDPMQRAREAGRTWSEGDGF